MVEQKISLETLKATCYTHQKESYRKNYSDEEINQLKDDLFKNSLEKSKKEELIKLISDSIKSDAFFTEQWGAITDMAHSFECTSSLKDLTSNFGKLLKVINQGYEIIEGIVYLLDFQEENIMAIYSEEGNLLYTRKLFENERQTSILSQIRKIN
jgi:hypothetical protein